MMIFIANSESWNQKTKRMEVFVLLFYRKNKEAEESIPSVGQQLKGTVKTSLGCSFIIS